MWIDFNVDDCIFFLRVRSRPRQLVWCGKDAILATWATSMALVGFEHQDVRFKMDEVTHVVAEADGCRVISNTKHYFLQKVRSLLDAIGQPRP